MIAVEVVPVPKVPANVTFDHDLLQKIDAAAVADGMNRSEWLRDAARAKLEWRKLTRERQRDIMAEVKA